MKDYNVMIDGQNFFDQPVKNNLRTNDNVQNLRYVKEMNKHMVIHYNSRHNILEYFNNFAYV